MSAPVTGMGEAAKLGRYIFNTPIFKRIIAAASC
jgi:hypothetical protein